MASRTFLLLFVSTAFAVVWTGDRRKEGEVLAARLNHSAAWTADKLEARRHATLAASDVLQPRGSVKLGPTAPDRLATGRYRLIAANGAACEIQVTPSDLAKLGVERVSATPLRTSLQDSDGRGFLIRLGGPVNEGPSVRMSLDDDVRRPIRM